VFEGNRDSPFVSFRQGCLPLIAVVMGVIEFFAACSPQVSEALLEALAVLWVFLAGARVRCEPQVMVVFSVLLR